MKRLLLLWALLWCLVFPYSQSVAHAQQTLVIGVEDKDWIGHYEWKGNVLLGVDADIVRAVAQRLGYMVEFKAMPWKRVLYMANYREIDGVLDLAPTKKRQRSLHFVWTPITTEGTAFWVKKGNKFDFDGTFTSEMKVGLMFGADWSDRFAKQGVPTVKRFSTYSAALDNLIVGNIDMFGNYIAATRYTAAKHGVLDKIEMLDLKYEGLPYYLALSHKKGHEELAKRFSAELKKFFRSPAYQELLDKYDAMDLVGDFK